MNLVRFANNTYQIDAETGFTYPVQYRDEYVGSEWLAPTGVASPDPVNVTIGGVGTRALAFNGAGTEERLSNSFEIPHDLAIVEVNEGTVEMEWHVHFRPSTDDAGVVQWWFDWSYTPPIQNGNTFAPIPMDSLNCVSTVVATTQYHQYICGTELVVPLGGFQLGGVIDFVLRRTPNGAGDTYEADALLIKTAMHIPTNSRGSRQRYIK